MEDVMKKIVMDKEKVYDMASVILNIYLSLAVLLFTVYLVQPLWGGKVFVNAILNYASWIGMALAGKYILSRVRKGQRLSVYEYSLLGLFYIACMFLWFRYPVNILFSILGVVSFVLTYRRKKVE